MRTSWAELRIPTLEDRFSVRDNAFGAIRLLLAVMVLVSHSWTLGFARPGLGQVGTDTGGQANAPAWYLWTNWFTSMDQYGISGLLEQKPYGRISGAGFFNCSLWSLRYELACYLTTGALAGYGVLRRAPQVVPLLATTGYLVIVGGSLSTAHRMPRLVSPGAVGPIPLFGSFNVNQTIHLGFVFLLGATIRLYRHRLPMHGALAAAALAVVFSLWLGGFVVVDLPAYAYLLCYLAVGLPARLRLIGRRHDLSYGIYLYSFPIQQLLVLFGGARLGLVSHLLASLLCSAAFAMLSWHLVEQPALRFKNRMPRLRRRPAAPSVRRRRLTLTRSGRPHRIARPRSGPAARGFVAVRWFLPP